MQKNTGKSVAYHSQAMFYNSGTAYDSFDLFLADDLVIQMNDVPRVSIWERYIANECQV